MKLLITGSRTWDRPDVITFALDGRLSGHCHKHTSLGRWIHDPARNADPLTIVWGRASRGADKMVTDWCRDHDQDADVEILPFDASWNTKPPDCDPMCNLPLYLHNKGYCPVAGHARNQKMVDVLDPAADYALIFLDERNGKKSTGTRDCQKRIRKAGIQNTVYSYNAAGLIDITSHGVIA